MVDRDNYTFHTDDLKMDLNTTMPVWLDWAIRDNLTCYEARMSQSYACVMSTNSKCRDSSNGPGYVCNCSKGYQGNPYLAGGCTGCCLEVDVPILVYEYVSNGSLDNILHDSNRVSLDLDLCLNIAAQSARGLAYMHSEITTPILHGDVKPANILLDENFVPMISDFGTSRMITIEDHYTSTIIGNWGYMDPEYAQTGLYTSKSDVYSFGVVLLELITRKKVLDPDISNLLGNFYDPYTTKKGVVELVDPEILAQGTIEMFHSLAEIIVQCLNLDVDLRPKMADVAERLQYLLK
nr:unnamed protein product [Digitaria exilis]